MAKYETINYTCDRCGKKMKKVARVLTFTKDISDLWKPKTWGTVSKSKHDLCSDCFSQFVDWMRVI